MSSRTINAPGIEINEIDRSAYDSVDNSMVGTLAMVLGFADKGDDYDVKWINSVAKLEQVYGIPQTEAERYFYNGCVEVLNQGGILVAGKLPYANNSLDMLAFTQYQFDRNLVPLSSVQDIFYSTNPGEIYVRENYDRIYDLNVNASLLYSEYLHENWWGTSIYDLSAATEDLSRRLPTRGVDLGQLSTLNEIKDALSGMTEAIKGLSVENSLCSLFMTTNGAELSAYLPSQTFAFARGLIRHVKDTCVFKFEDQDAADMYLNPNLFSSVQNLYRMFDGDPELSALREDIAPLYPDMETLLGSFLRTVSLDVFRDSYWELSGLLAETELSDMVSSKIPPEVAEVYFSAPDTELKQFDDNITSMIELRSVPPARTSLMSYDQFDNLATGVSKAPTNGMYIVDITRQKYQNDLKGNQYLGIVPVVTTAANALYYMNYLVSGTGTYSRENVVSAICNTKGSPESLSQGWLSSEDGGFLPLNKDTSLSTITGFNRFVGGEEAAPDDDFTLSRQSLDYFPQFEFSNDHVNPAQLKQIGIVVFKAFTDQSDQGKTGFIPVEAFVGSPRRGEIDPATGRNVFIDDVVNQTSRYINVFSNVKFAKRGEDPTQFDRASVFHTSNQLAASLGFYTVDTKKEIEVKTSILKGLDRIFSNNEDPNKIDVDIICDAGVSNIAQFIASTCVNNRDPFLRKGYFDLDSDNAQFFRLNTREDCKVWATVLKKYDDFVKNVRKDCMFIADGPRPLCLEGQQKIVRKTRPTNTVMNSIVPRIRLISNVVNSSYSAGYMNWFQAADAATGQFFWCPPSIKAMGIYLYTDRYTNYWEAPAGLNRGVVGGVVDVAFNPTNEEAGYIYPNSWNYAVSYPVGGIVLEGQRTFQTNKTALDRVNVRRLLLGLEKATRDYAKYFNYEGNTEWLRQRFTDILDRYFTQVVNGGGLNDFLVVCDDRNNTTQTIENNELHVSVYVKPVKTVEFLVLDFICTNQSVSIQEMAESDLG